LALVFLKSSFNLILNPILGQIDQPRLLHCKCWA